MSLKEVKKSLSNKAFIQAAIKHLKQVYDNPEDKNVGAFIRTLDEVRKANAAPAR